MRICYVIKSLVYDISSSRAHSKLKAENHFNIGRNCSHFFYIFRPPACWADASYTTQEHFDIEENKAEPSKIQQNIPKGMELKCSNHFNTQIISAI